LGHLSAELRCGQISIYDLMGKVIAQKPLATNIENIIIDTRNVPDGIYFFRVDCGKSQSHSGKFIVKKP
jgi:Secretion system C-terminal sorting domain